MSTQSQAVDEWLEQIQWNQDGLVPAIAQDAESGTVLMMAWMNRKALAETIKTKHAVYWSRSRQKLWRKGEESGHTQSVQEVRLDCDNDVVLMKVLQKGEIACHTGRKSCFYKSFSNDKWLFLRLNNKLNKWLKIS